MKAIILNILAILIISGAIYAQDALSEENMFSDTETVKNSNTVIDNSIISNHDKTSVSLTGQVQSMNSYMMNRDWIAGKIGSESNQFLPIMQGNLFLDVRLTKGFKAFANVGVYYSPVGQLTPHYYIDPVAGQNKVYYETNTTVLNLTEFFVDGNINKAVYIRAGKQSLAWGVCYYWNPTDLINVQKINFQNLTAYRDGSTGLKITVPFGTVFNFYSFLDVTQAKKIEDTALALKAEALLGDTEIALSTWSRKDFHPVYGIDFTTKVFTMDLYGEAAFSDWDSQTRISNSVTGSITNVVPYQLTNQLVTKICVGLSRTFEMWNIADRLSLRTEFFYNSAGYSDNIFAVKENRDYLNVAALYGINAFVQDYNAKYYAALFSSFAQFFNSDVILNFNTIVNLVDYSLVLAPGLDYNPINNFYVDFYLYNYIGAANGEYTFKGYAMNAILTATLRF